MCGGVCVPSRRQCVGTTPQVCGTNGQWMNTTGNECLKDRGETCGNANECATGACVTGGRCCTPGEKYCDSQCRASGYCCNGNYVSGHQRQWYVLGRRMPGYLQSGFHEARRPVRLQPTRVQRAVPTMLCPCRLRPEPDLHQRDVHEHYQLWGVPTRQQSYLRRYASGSCSGGGTCQNGTCVVKRPNGSDCSSPGDCVSNFCPQTTAAPAAKSTKITPAELLVEKGTLDVQATRPRRDALTEGGKRQIARTSRTAVQYAAMSSA